MPITMQGSLRPLDGLVERKLGGRLSEQGRARLLSKGGEPLFLAAWERVLFIHFEVDAAALQRDVPFQLDLYQGRAFVSLVAFTMRGMRPRVGGKLAAWPFKPFAEQRFLNVRTYVRQGGERGIYFITEWLSSWLNAQLGPLLYGLPYHYADLNYRHRHEANFLAGRVTSKRGGQQFNYSARLLPDAHYVPSHEGSLDEFLLERYTAYTARAAAQRFFRIWHPPWLQQPVKVSISDDSLLVGKFPWFRAAEYMGANYSSGFDEVWMGRAQRV